MSNQEIERKLDLVIHLLETMPIKMMQEYAARQEVIEYKKKEREIKELSKKNGK